MTNAVDRAHGLDALWAAQGVVGLDGKNPPAIDNYTTGQKVQKLLILTRAFEQADPNHNRSLALQKAKALTDAEIVGKPFMPRSGSDRIDLTKLSVGDHVIFQPQDRAVRELVILSPANADGILRVGEVQADNTVKVSLIRATEPLAVGKPFTYEDMTAGAGGRQSFPKIVRLETPVTEPLGTLPLTRFAYTTLHVGDVFSVETTIGEQRSFRVERIDNGQPVLTQTAVNGVADGTVFRLANDITPGSRLQVLNVDGQRIPNGEVVATITFDQVATAQAQQGQSLVDTSVTSQQTLWQKITGSSIVRWAFGGDTARLGTGREPTAIEPISEEAANSQPLAFAEIATTFPELAVAIDYHVRAAAPPMPEGLAPLNPDQFSKLRDEILDTIRRESGTNPYHNEAHTLEVERRFAELAAHAQLSPAADQFGRLSALLHDYGHIGQTLRQNGPEDTDLKTISNEEYAAVRAGELLTRHLGEVHLKPEQIQELVTFVQFNVLGTTFGQGPTSPYPRPYKSRGDVGQILALADIGGFMEGFKPWMDQAMNVYREMAPATFPKDFSAMLQAQRGFLNYIESELHKVAPLLDEAYVSGLRLQIASHRRELLDGNAVEQYREPFEVILAEKFPSADTIVPSNPAINLDDYTVFGAGMQGTVFQANNGADTVLIKIFDKVSGVGEAEIRELAWISEQLRAAGLPVIGMEAVPLADGRWAIRMERVEGETLEEFSLERGLADPINLDPTVSRLRAEASAILDQIDALTRGEEHNDTLTDRLQRLSPTVGLQDVFANFIVVEVAAGQYQLVNIDPINMIQLQTRLDAGQATVAPPLQIGPEAELQTAALERFREALLQQRNIYDFTYTDRVVATWYAAYRAGVPQSDLTEIARAMASHKLGTFLEYLPRIGDDLLKVGPHKPLGYLPAAYFEHVFGGQSPDDFFRERQRINPNLRLKVYGPDSHSKFVEPIYLYDMAALADFLRSPLHAKILAYYGWPTDPDQFVEFVSTTTGSAGPLYRLIGQAFADPRFWPEQPLDTFTTLLDEMITLEKIHQDRIGWLPRAWDHLTGSLPKRQIQLIALKTDLLRQAALDALAAGVNEVELRQVIAERNQAARDLGYATPITANDVYEIMKPTIAAPTIASDPLHELQVAVAAYTTLLDEIEANGIPEAVVPEFYQVVQQLDGRWSVVDVNTNAPVYLLAQDLVIESADGTYTIDEARLGEAAIFADKTAAETHARLLAAQRLRPNELVDASGDLVKRIYETLQAVLDTEGDTTAMVIAGTEVPVERYVASVLDRGVRILAAVESDRLMIRTEALKELKQRYPNGWMISPTPTSPGQFDVLGFDRQTVLVSFVRGSADADRLTALGVKNQLLPPHEAAAAVARIVKEIIGYETALNDEKFGRASLDVPGGLAGYWERIFSFVYGLPSESGNSAAERQTQIANVLTDYNQRINALLHELPFVMRDALAAGVSQVELDKILKQVRADLTTIRFVLEAYTPPTVASNAAPLVTEPMTVVAGIPQPVPLSEQVIALETRIRDAQAVLESERSSADDRLAAATDLRAADGALQSLLSQLPATESQMTEDEALALVEARDFQRRTLAVVREPIAVAAPAAPSVREPAFATEGAERVNLPEQTAAAGPPIQEVILAEIAAPGAVADAINQPETVVGEPTSSLAARSLIQTATAMENFTITPEQTAALNQNNAEVFRRFPEKQQAVEQAQGALNLAKHLAATSNAAFVQLPLDEQRVFTGQLQVAEQQLLKSITTIQGLETPQFYIDTEGTLRSVDDLARVAQAVHQLRTDRLQLLAAQAPADVVTELAIVSEPEAGTKPAQEIFPDEPLNLVTDLQYPIEERLAFIDDLARGLNEASVEANRLTRLRAAGALAQLVNPPAAVAETIKTKTLVVMVGRNTTDPLTPITDRLSSGDYRVRLKTAPGTLAQVLPAIEEATAAGIRVELIYTNEAPDVTAANYLTSVTAREAFGASVDQLDTLVSSLERAATDQQTVWQLVWDGWRYEGTAGVTVSVIDAAQPLPDDPTKTVEPFLAPELSKAVDQLLVLSRPRPTIEETIRRLDATQLTGISAGTRTRLDLGDVGGSGRGTLEPGTGSGRPGSELEAESGGVSETREAGAAAPTGNTGGTQGAAAPAGRAALIDPDTLDPATMQAIRRVAGLDSRNVTLVSPATVDRFLADLQTTLVDPSSSLEEAVAARAADPLAQANAALADLAALRDEAVAIITRAQRHEEGFDPLDTASDLGDPAQLIRERLDELVKTTPITETIAHDLGNAALNLPAITMVVLVDDAHRTLEEKLALLDERLESKFDNPLEGARAFINGEDTPRPLADLLHRLEKPISGTKARVAIEVHGDIPERIVNQSYQVREALVEFINNTLKGYEQANPSDIVVKGKVDIRVLEQPDGGISIAVADAVPGGIPLEKIVAKAIALGIITEDEAAKLTDQAKAELIFEPKLSTREVGGGLGLDAHRAVVASLGGTLALDHAATGRNGTTIVMTLPATALSPSTPAAAEAELKQAVSKYDDFLDTLVQRQRPSDPVRLTAETAIRQHHVGRIEQAVQQLATIGDGTIALTADLPDVRIPADVYAAMALERGARLFGEAAVPQAVDSYRFAEGLATIQLPDQPIELTPDVTPALAGRVTIPLPIDRPLTPEVQAIFDAEFADLRTRQFPLWQDNPTLAYMAARDQADYAQTVLHDATATPIQQLEAHQALLAATERLEVLQTKLLAATPALVGTNAFVLEQVTNRLAQLRATVGLTEAPGQTTIGQEILAETPASVSLRPKQPTVVIGDTVVRLGGEVPRLVYSYQTLIKPDWLPELRTNGSLRISLNGDTLKFDVFDATGTKLKSLGDDHALYQALERANIADIYLRADGRFFLVLEELPAPPPVEFVEVADVGKPLGEDSSVALTDKGLRFTYKTPEQVVLDAVAEQAAAVQAGRLQPDQAAAYLVPEEILAGQRAEITSLLDDLTSGQLDTIVVVDVRRGLDQATALPLESADATKYFQGVLAEYDAVATEAGLETVYQATQAEITRLFAGEPVPAEFQTALRFGAVALSPVNLAVFDPTSVHQLTSGGGASLPREAGGGQRFTVESYVDPSDPAGLRRKFAILDLFESDDQGDPVRITANLDVPPSETFLTQLNRVPTTIGLEQALAISTIYNPSQRQAVEHPLGDFLTHQEQVTLVYQQLEALSAGVRASAGLEKPVTDLDYTADGFRFAYKTPEQVVVETIAQQAQAIQAGNMEFGATPVIPESILAARQADIAKILALIETNPGLRINIIDASQELTTAEGEVRQGRAAREYFTQLADGYTKASTPEEVGRMYAAARREVERISGGAGETANGLITALGIGEGRIGVGSRPDDQGTSGVAGSAQTDVYPGGEGAGGQAGSGTGARLGGEDTEGVGSGSKEGQTTAAGEAELATAKLSLASFVQSLGDPNTNVTEILTTAEAAQQAVNRTTSADLRGDFEAMLARLSSDERLKEAEQLLLDPTCPEAAKPVWFARVLGVLPALAHHCLIDEQQQALELQLRQQFQQFGINIEELRSLAEQDPAAAQAEFWKGLALDQPTLRVETEIGNLIDQGALPVVDGVNPHDLSNATPIVGSPSSPALVVVGGTIVEPTEIVVTPVDPASTGVEITSPPETPLPAAPQLSDVQQALLTYLEVNPTLVPEGKTALQIVTQSVLTIGTGNTSRLVPPAEQILGETHDAQAIQLALLASGQSHRLGYDDIRGTGQMEPLNARQLQAIDTFQQFLAEYHPLQDIVEQGRFSDDPTERAFELERIAQLDNERFTHEQRLRELGINQMTVIVRNPDGSVGPARTATVEELLG
ncbi:hypothetical protein HY523_00510, partial [Candidatus Berkelbacteria bacterium]|nr:hypothetical protein [Candidatus Berkelbacteria bacterium]